MAFDKLVRWDGKEILGVRSTGSSVFAALDWRDLALEPTGEAIIRKAFQPAPRSLQAFPREHYADLKRVLGHYSSVQSLNSEDTVTWSVFGGSRSTTWISSLFRSAFNSMVDQQSWKVSLWKRTIHPETGIEQQGPEADVVISSDESYFAVEAKWTADIDAEQGVRKNLTQLDMRYASVLKTGLPKTTRGVLVIAPGPEKYAYARRRTSCFHRYFRISENKYKPTDLAMGIEAKAITWEGVLAILETYPEYGQAAQYLRWRLLHLNPSGVDRGCNLAFGNPIQ